MSDYALPMTSTADDTASGGYSGPTPDYEGAGIVNLMSSIATGRGAADGLYAPLSMLAPLDLAGYRNVVLMVIDGLGYRYLTDRFPDSVIARHTRGPVSSVFPTTTAAAITTLLTGLAPAQHGLTGWFVWLEELRQVTAVLPFQTRIGRESLAARGYDPAQLLDARPLYPRLAVDCHVVSPARIAHSPFNKAFSRGARIHSFGTIAEYVERIAAIVAADTAEKYIYAYWSDLDHLGHEVGLESDTTRAHFEEIDRAYAHLLARLENSDTLVLLTADHGIVDTEPDTHVHLHTHPALTAMLDVPLCGEPRAAYCYVHPGEHAAFENYMSAELQREAAVYASGDLLNAGLFGPGAPHPALHRRVGDYTVLMRENYAISDTVAGETPSTLVGVHGGLSEAELYVPLAVVET